MKIEFGLCLIMFFPIPAEKDPIFAEEVLVTICLGISAKFLPLPVMFFEIIVAFIQATVFMMLTIAYISMAVTEEEV